MAASILVGCGTLCDRATSVERGFQAKRPEACDVSTILVASKQECEENIQACTPADREKMLAWLDCLEKLPTCTPERPTEFRESYNACRAQLDGISEVCWDLDP
jgi:hypothetical protein